MITFAGAFGGLLFTARDDGFTKPHRDPENKYAWKLGWVSDCAYGIAGGYVVFLILPNNSNLIDSTKILSFLQPLALALVGGYGGRSLVDRALANVANDAKEAIKTAQETKTQMIQIQESDTLAIELVMQHLDENSEVQDIQELQEAIKKASLTTRLEIFREAREFRKSNWEKNPELIERTIPIFKALIENSAGEKFHRTHAQLGYALKDQTNPNWKEAFEELSKAIMLRDDKGAKGFLMYEFNRAICGIKLQLERNLILQDIKAAANRKELSKKMRLMNDFKNWAEVNGESINQILGQTP
ncbi:hypothetical protein QQ008_24700 [Fulvivirgaceae bacterium BMA10]|uniref:Uncharacterized protein n=1 Tax=Splendidivirga corallicola TaxID=3051826 RepID=A0ABT8KYY1_9BACT|nr:hypothetical protein [Fulvivirgaceae bacterium BMA10]